MFSLCMVSIQAVCNPEKVMMAPVRYLKWIWSGVLPKQVDSNFCPSLYLSFEPFISNYSGVLEEDHSVCTAARKIFLFFAASCPWDDRFLLTAYLLLVSDQLCYKNVVKPFLVKIQFYAPSVSNLRIVTDPFYRILPNRS